MFCQQGVAEFVTTIGLSRARTCVHTGAHTHTRAPTNSMYPNWPMTQAAKKKRAQPAVAPDAAQDPAHGPAARTAKSPAPSTPDRGRRTQVRDSKVHGKGVFAIRPLRAGDTVLEYKGEIISWKEALRRHPHDPSQPNHTFYFHLDDGHVIDGKHQGNSAKWINHSCAPNLEAEQDGNRVFLKALRDIAVEEELFFDYGLIIDARQTAKLKKEYACWCGAKACRGTMLAPKGKR